MRIRDANLYIRNVSFGCCKENKVRWSEFGYLREECVEGVGDGERLISVAGFF